MEKIFNRRPDKEGYDYHYKGTGSRLLDYESINHFMRDIGSQMLQPFYLGGGSYGYITGLAVKYLIDVGRSSRKDPSQLRILDAGCGLGRLSVYLSCKGYNVIGVDISTEACYVAERVAQNLGVSNHCKFLAESLEHTSVRDSSIDLIIGKGSFHHFIKYEGVRKEFRRIMKKGAQGFFIDAFGENPLYRLFHDKNRMKRLGDVVLTRDLIIKYFDEFEIELVPTDWFTMLDKMYLRFVRPGSPPEVLRKLSRFHFQLDRRIPSSSRIALFLSGRVLTHITQVPDSN